MRMKIHLIVSLDTECDKGDGWNTIYPLSFSNIMEGIPNQLAPLWDHFEIRPTFLLSPEVIGNADCASLFRSFGRNVELGTHLHAEFIEPCCNPNALRTEAFQSDYPPDVEYAKLRNLTNMFRQTFGYSPRSFRAGRYGISRHTLTFLEDLGYLVDSSVTPYMWWWRRRGEGVNFLGASNQPYHPAPGDFRRPGSMKITEVPISMVNHFWDRFPRSILLRINPIQRIQTILINVLLKNRIRCRWVRPTFSTAEEMISVTEHLVRQQRTETVVICMMFHSNEASVGTSPYNRSAEELGAFLGRLEQYCRRLFSIYDVKPIGLSEAAELAQ